MMSNRQKLETPIEIINIIKFLCEVSNPYGIKIIRLLYNGDKPYIQLFHEFGFYKKSQSGRFAYYIRHLLATNLIKKDPLTKQYGLTFRGLKAAELLDSVEKIANLSMDTLSDAKVRIAVDLNENKCWLAPLIKTEIRRAVKELRH
jgi:hypothetical protein